MSIFYVVKFDNVQNAPFFWLFAQCAKALSKCARGGPRCAIFAQLRKIWQHCLRGMKKENCEACERVASNARGPQDSPMPGRLPGYTQSIN